MKLQTSGMFKDYNYEDRGLICLSDEQLKQVQSSLWSMFQEIAAVCDRHDIAYGFCGGSAIGTLRHHGFLPWDDDLDVFMPREDFDRLEQIFAEELGDRYWLHTPQNHDGYRILLCRIRKKDTVYRLRDDLDEEEAGLFIDIFVLENTYDNKLLRAIHGFNSYVFGFLFSCRKYKEDREKLLEYVGENRELAKAIRVKSRIGTLCSFASLNRWRKWADRVHRMCHNSHSKYVVSPAGRGLFFKETYHRENMCRMRQERFLDGMAYVPAGVEEHLEKIYGSDFMIPPEENKREAHILFELQL